MIHYLAVEPDGRTICSFCCMFHDVVQTRTLLVCSLPNEEAGGWFEARLVRWGSRILPIETALARKSILRLARPTMAASSVDSFRQAAASEDRPSGRRQRRIPLQGRLGKFRNPSCCKINPYLGR